MIVSLTFGNVELKHGLMLAPMAGVTDLAFRRICRRHGAEYTVTEMVSAKALHFNDTTSLDLEQSLEGWRLSWRSGGSTPGKEGTGWNLRLRGLKEKDLFLQGP